ncbi:hypothetical protein BATDEDRAFT_85241 [Batrachochytrium dendrobatidis JAM81]|uniref:Cytochrome c oxidase assembly factor 6 n=2 Tax=Batrachochytrium dendrobatidis TaxID=109871 RepID=F4NUT0_BATDJ|nr:uncharacterized protein BATDEDRAFT_85241 [Batrachochytrium dendrobatidis JAM81]EGF84437.1 hypothetical protein BATDEDRAFT_85241 [Batrachochytrium dendrobatidis JAM81]KAJ8327397.1 hypothetical protein O5D80_004787 [Batrachochytrium dendrobatidis]KAK5665214.1 hypothetical protein QVD99_008059 [Batrachochytrium dendrobatidis]OAJ37501.1 hypothetical protein BDEG_21515 [Batrachochytrium dendrobatidis JEL423]|eukprot:XP_006676438.1 hypothetical protein BATDEDRAFT_85241 [Batrachochytrium dendrobatidis JAM81]
MSAPPSRAERNKCWKARDLYFECLDQKQLWLHGFAPTEYNEIVQLDPLAKHGKSESDRTLTKEERNKLFTCHQSHLFFEKECLPSWVQHFSMLRVKDLQSKAMVDNLRKTQEERHQKKNEFWERVKKN